MNPPLLQASPHPPPPPRASPVPDFSGLHQTRTRLLAALQAQDELSTKIIHDLCSIEFPLYTAGAAAAPEVIPHHADVYALENIRRLHRRRHKLRCALRRVSREERSLLDQLGRVTHEIQMRERWARAGDPRCTSWTREELLAMPPPPPAPGVGSEEPPAQSPPLRRPFQDMSHFFASRSSFVPAKNWLDRWLDTHFVDTPIPYVARPAPVPPRPSPRQDPLQQGNDDDDHGKPSPLSANEDADKDNPSSSSFALPFRLKMRKKSDFDAGRTEYVGYGVLKEPRRVTTLEHASLSNRNPFSNDIF